MTDSKLVDAEGLLEALFTPKARPSLRWLWRQKKSRIIPYVKVGRLVFFEVDAVREALRKKRTVKERV